MDTLNSVLKILVTTAISFQGIAALLSIVFFYKYKKSYLALLPLYLLYTFAIEYISVFHPSVENFNKSFRYNIAAFITFSYFIYIFFKSVNTKHHRKIISIAFVFYLLSIIFSAIYYEISKESYLPAYYLGSCSLVLCTILFFLEQLKKPNLSFVNEDLIFWFSIGILLFYVGYPPLKLALSYPASNEGKILLKTVQMILVIVFNLSISIGLIWTPKQ